MSPDDLEGRTAKQVLIEAPALARKLYPRGKRRGKGPRDDRGPSAHELQVLVAFADDPDQRLEDAATQLALHLSSVSKAVKTLESLGLIEVEALGGGRQMRRLLTHEGRSVVSRLVGHAEDVLNERKPG